MMALIMKSSRETYIKRMVPMLMIRSNKSTIMVKWMVEINKSTEMAMESRSMSTTTSLMVLAGTLSQRS
jgi:hypothetical protein